MPSWRSPVREPLRHADPVVEADVDHQVTVRLHPRGGCGGAPPPLTWAVFRVRLAHRTGKVLFGSLEGAQQRNNPGLGYGQRQQRLRGKTGQESRRRVACGCLARSRQRVGAGTTLNATCCGDWRWDEKSPGGWPELCLLTPGSRLFALGFSSCAGQADFEHPNRDTFCRAAS